MRSLLQVYEGWEGFQGSLVKAIEPLTREQLTFRPSADVKSAGEIAAHIAVGRVDWFHRMGAPASEPLYEQAAPLIDDFGKPTAAYAALTADSGEVVRWLQASWHMMEETLRPWTVDDLDWTYPQPYQGKIYAVSRQWVIWRMLSHDIYHGGQITILLGLQGIVPLELAELGGHLTEPPLMDGV